LHSLPGRRAILKKEKKRKAYYFKLLHERAFILPRDFLHSFPGLPPGNDMQQIIILNG